MPLAPAPAKVIETLRKDGSVRVVRSIDRHLRSRLRGGAVACRSYVNHLCNAIRFDAPAHPYQPVIIDPDDVEYDGTWVSPAREGLGRVEAGDWDAPDELGSIEEQFIVKGLKQRFEEGRPWRETSYIENRRKVIEDRGSVWGCTSTEEFVEKRCAYVERIYEDIKANRYRPEAAGSDDNEKDPGRSQYYQELEPLVTIGRDGSIIMADGYHRFAIADILDLEIPVNVVRRHERWQLLRDEIYNADAGKGVGDYEEGLLDHPDLQDVI